MKGILTFILVCIGIGSAWGQRVGVVLSGGGAKGLYHVGILKALEDNNIPIDYVSGASMGAIVGGMYAAGFSPDEMIEFFITDSVPGWLSMKSSDLDNSYYFKKFEPTPTMVSLRFDPKASKSNPAIQLPTNFISPYKLDLAFLRMLYPASAVAANQSFDSLMVPFRCNASDIYQKKTVVFDQGNLPAAIRASMTIPLVFKPLVKDTTILFDGGIYNNFPWQPLDSTFHPDILIGGICASNYENPSADNIIQQVTVMATAKTDYTLPDSLDITIQRKLTEVNMLDYNRASYIMARGYEDAMKMMPVIKERIKRRVSDEEIAAKRAAFRAKMKPYIFESLEIEGLNEKQTRYVYRQLGLEANQLFDAAYFERKYMQVLAGGVFSCDFPDVTYNPETGFFRMKLTMQTQPSLKLSLGGNISSTALNQGYADFTYRRVGNSASTYGIRGFFGTFYSAVQGIGRHDIYTNFPFYIEYGYMYENYDYQANHMNRYYKDRSWRYSKRQNNMFGTSIAIPVLQNSAFRGRFTWGVTQDEYFQLIHTNLDRPDKSTYTHASISAEIQQHSLNYVLFPTEGLNELLSVKYTEGLERYSPNTPLDGTPAYGRRNRNWIEAHYQREQYYRISNMFTLGTLVNVAVSNVPSFANPLAKAMWEPAFQPIPMMQTMFMPEYRSASFVGLGIMPVFNIANNVYIKSYAFAFVPQEVIYDGGWVTNNFWNRVRTQSEFVFGGAVVYQSLIGPASLSLNKYTTGKKSWQLVFNFGYTLFASRKF